MAAEKYYADLHCHASLIAYNINRNKFWDYDPPRERQRDNFLSTFFLSPFSQTEFSIMAKAGIKLAFISLYQVEQGFFDNLFLEPFGEKKKKGMIANKVLREITDNPKFNEVRNAGARIVFNMPSSRYEEIDSDEFNYFDDINKEYKYITQQIAQPQTVDGKQYRFFIPDNFHHLQQMLSLDADYNITNASNGNIAIMLTIEGGHALGLGLKDLLLIADEDLDSVDGNDVFTNPQVEALWQKIKTNIALLKKWGSDTGNNHRPVFLTFTHHFWNQLCGHAMSFATMMHKGFNQQRGMTKGFTLLGEKVMDQLLELNNPNSNTRILIDAKHLSIKARQTFYSKIKAHNNSTSGKKISVIASHTAVNQLATISDVYAGKSHDEMDAIYDASGIFNPWDINLSDEEIINIYESGGLIGLIMDQRVLSGQKMINQISKIIKDQKLKADSLLYKSLWAEPLVQNLLHIVNTILKVHSSDTEKAWQVMSIGSDFDGMINPVDAFCFSEDFPTLRIIIVEKLILRAPIEISLQGKSLIQIEQLVDGVMFKNAVRFLHQNF